MKTPNSLYLGYDTKKAFIEAQHCFINAGFSNINSYAPHGEAESVTPNTHKKTSTKKQLLLGAFIGAGLAFAFQYFVHVHGYPLNIGGKQCNSFLSFIPVTFECGILGAVMSCVFSFSRTKKNISQQVFKMVSNDLYVIELAN